MSNAWFRDASTKEGEGKAFEAERAERRGNSTEARALHHQAGEAFERVAMRVPVDHPNTRSDLAIAAVASFARAGDLGRAVSLATRMLVEIDALSPYGRAELGRLRSEYSALMTSAVTSPVPGASTRKPTLRASGQGKDRRDDVRGRFQRPERRGS